MKPSTLLSLNPELQRNIWLELTTTRLIGMVVVLAVLFGAFYEVDKGSAEPGSGNFPYLAHTIRFAILALVMLWGSRLASESLTDEITDRTWDVQRLSAQGAASLVIGKLIGGTIYIWYGALLCVAVMAAMLPDRLFQVPDLVLTGLLAQSTALFVALALSRFHTGSRRVGNLTAQMIGILAGLCFNEFSGRAVADASQSFYLQTQREWIESRLDWYGLQMTLLSFAELLAALFTLSMLVGSIRLVRRELGYRDYPIVWALFVVLAMAFAAGIDFTTKFGPLNWTSWQGAILTVGGLLTYVALLGMPSSLSAMRALLAALRSGRTGLVWRDLPPWVVAAALSLVASILYVIHDPALLPGTLAAIGFLARDALVVYTLRLRYARRVGVSLMVFLVGTYLLGPTVVTGGLRFMVQPPDPIIKLAWFLPIVPAGQAWAALFPWVEATAALGIFLLASRRTMTSMASEDGPAQKPSAAAQSNAPWA